MFFIYKPNPNPSLKGRELFAAIAAVIQNFNVFFLPKRNNCGGIDN
jgi:hypothetical protein